MKYIINKNVFIDKDEIAEVQAIEHDTKTRFINFRFLANNLPFDLTNCKIRVYGKNNNDKEIFNDLTIIDAKKGIAELELTDNFLIPGITKYQLKIMPNSGGQLSSNVMQLTIKNNLMSGNEIESTNEYGALENSLKTINKYDSKIENLNFKLSEKAGLVNKLLYKTVSNTVKNEDDSDLHTDNIYEHLKYQNANLVLVTMVNITSSTDSSPEMMKDDKIISYINKAKAHDVKTVMLKPHLGVNWQDSFNRTNFKPSDIQTFFENWTDILLHYAQLCNDYDIPILCVGCEQDKITTIEYKSNWNNIYNTIKAKYPNLLITYACNQLEWLKDENAIFENVDFIGLNAYLQWSNTPYNSGITWQDIIPSFYTSYDVLDDGVQFMERVNFLSNRYNKKIFVTEIGVVPTPNGLITVVPKDTTNINYSISALVYEALFNVALATPNIVGLSIWHIDSPFSYFDITSTTHNQTEAIIKKYFTEVI